MSAKSLQNIDRLLGGEKKCSVCFVNVTVGLSHLCTVALGGGGGGRVLPHMTYKGL